MEKTAAERIREMFAAAGVPELTEAEKAQMAETQADLAKRAAQKTAHPPYTPGEDYSYARPQSARNTAIYDICELDPMAERIG